MVNGALKRYIQGVIVLLFLSLAVPGGLSAGSVKTDGPSAYKLNR